MAGLDRDARLAELAYRAHDQALGPNLPMPPWEGLPPRVKTAWEVTVTTIQRATLRERS